MINALLVKDESTNPLFIEKLENSLKTSNINLKVVLFSAELSLFSEKHDILLLTTTFLKSATDVITTDYRAHLNIKPPLVIGFGDAELTSPELPNIVFDVLPLNVNTSFYTSFFKKLVVQLDHFTIYPSQTIDTGVQQHKTPQWVVESDVMKNLVKTIHRLAVFDTTVLIKGESGTGKELVARELHLQSTRNNSPFIAINCGAIPESLLESELFGHRKGAFTDATQDKRGLFEEANGGTLFLDEIGEMPLQLQVKLLRALQERAIRPVGAETITPINVRIVAATLRDLEKDVYGGRFREDLLYRLNVVTIHLPPLRERKIEIPILVRHFIKKHAKRLGIKLKNLSEKALNLLLAYHWPGNIRELENCIERALVLSTDSIIDVDKLPPNISSFGLSNPDYSDRSHLSFDSLSIKEKTKELERTLIAKALTTTKGNRTRAAKILEISHRALLYKLKEYQFE